MTESTNELSDGQQNIKSYQIENNVNITYNNHRNN